MKFDGWKTTFLLGRPIFRCYVSFRESMCYYCDILIYKPKVQKGATSIYIHLLQSVVVAVSLIPTSLAVTIGNATLPRHSMTKDVINPAICVAAPVALFTALGQHI